MSGLVAIEMPDGTGAFGVGGPLGAASSSPRRTNPLLRAIRDKETEIAGLERELAATTVDQHELDRDLALIEHDLVHVRFLLAGSVTQARQILKVFLPSPLIFTPQNGGYDIQGQCNLGGLVRFQNKEQTPGDQSILKDGFRARMRLLEKGEGELQSRGERRRGTADYMDRPPAGIAESRVTWLSS